MKYHLHNNIHFGLYRFYSEKHLISPEYKQSPDTAVKNA